MTQATTVTDPTGVFGDARAEERGEAWALIVLWAAAPGRVEEVALIPWGAEAGSVR